MMNFKTISVLILSFGLGLSAFAEGKFVGEKFVGQKFLVTGKYNARSKVMRDDDGTRYNISSEKKNFKSCKDAVATLEDVGDGYVLLELICYD